MAAFLKKAISIAGDEGKKDATILKAVNETDKTWKGVLIESFSFEPSPDITPCLFALLQSNIDKNSTALAKTFKEQCKFDSKAKMYSHELCQQVFNELLTFRYYDEIKEEDE